MSKQISVSVIIPVYHQWEQLSICLECLATQTLSKDDYQVIVVNNDPHDRCPFSMPASNMLILSESRPGSYAARNCGIRHADGTILAFTDADCRPSKDWLRAGLSALRTAGTDAFLGGQVVLYSTASRSNRWELFDKTFGFDQARYGKAGYFVTANVFYYRRVFDSLGGFSESRFSGGDTDLGLRATNAGWRPIFEPSAVVYHPARSTRRSVRTKYRRIIGGRVSGIVARNMSIVPLAVDIISPPGRAFFKLYQSVASIGFVRAVLVFDVLVRDVWFESVKELARLVLFRRQFERT